MTRYAAFSVDFTNGENATDTHFAEDGHPATIEITDLWVIIRTDITETWITRERIASVSVGTDSATPAPVCGAMYTDIHGTPDNLPCILQPNHDGQHADRTDSRWP